MNFRSAPLLSMSRHWVILPLLIMQLWLAIGRSERVGMTADEGIHIVSGMYYNRVGDFRFHPENGSLPQRLFALPWQLAGEPLPATDGRTWERGNAWEAFDLLYDNAGERAVVLLNWSRFINALAGLGVVLVVYFWSLRLFGLTGALLAASFAAFCPNLLGHSGVTTTDVWGVLGLLLATLAWWRLCHRVSTGRILGAGLAAGFLAVCKFNCVLLAPIAALLLALRLLHRAPLRCKFFGVGQRLRGWHRVPILAGGSIAATLLAIGVIWSAYGFRFAASPEGQDRFIQPWSTVLIENPSMVGLAQLGYPIDAHGVLLKRGILQESVTLFREHRVLPEAWLWGLAFVGRNAQSRLSYLNGEYSQTGWPEYFPLAFLLKTPLGGLLALIATCFAWTFIPRKLRLAHRLAPLLVLIAVLLAAAIPGRLNIGLRHILPVIVALWVLVGCIAVTRSGRARYILLALAFSGLLGQMLASFRAAPHTLTFFNAFAGPAPDRWLVDSNLDWGQGLPELRVWLDAQTQKRPLHLSYFGEDKPERYGIDAIHFADPDSTLLPAPLQPGWFAFGPTQFRRAYTETRGPWSMTREALYQQIKREIWNLRAAWKDDPDWTPTAGQQLMLRDYDRLRLGRLGLYLDQRLPDHRLPGGIMIFELDADDIQLAFNQSLSALLDGAEKRAAK